LPTAALGVVIAVIGLILWRLIFPTAPDVLIEAVAITNYTSPVIPPNDFAERDLKAIEFGQDSRDPAERISTLIAGDSDTSQTVQRLNELFDQKLLSDAADKNTVVVYLSAHGVASDKEAFLLTSEAEVGSARTGWYRVRDVLEKLARCEAPNKLLILDTTRIQRDLDLGLLGNDFLYHLQRDFTAVAQELKGSDPQGKHHFWVICASDEGQPVWTSTSERRSWFGTLVAYGLAGGREANQPSADGREDGKIDAQELVNFVNLQLEAWQKERNRAAQTVVVFKHGDSFPLTRVDPRRSLADFISALAAAETAAVETPGDTPAEPAAEGQAKEAPQAGEKSTTSPLTRDAIENRINQLWQTRDQIAQKNRPTALGRVYLWNWFQQQLMWVEQLLLADRLKKCDDRLGILEAVAQELQKPLDWPRIDHPWSLALIDDPKVLEKQQDALKQFVKQPADPKGLADNALVEAELLKLLAKKRTEKEKWPDESIVKIVDEALQTRTLAEKTARLDVVTLFSSLRDQVEEADRLRRAGETELTLSAAVMRPAVAVSRFAQARDQYQRVLEDTTRLSEELAAVRLVLADTAYLIRWLGARGIESESRAVEYKSLAELLDGARRLGEAEVAHAELRAATRRLHTLAEDLRRLARAYAASARSWFQAKAALEIPWLDAKERARLRAILADDRSPAPQGARYSEQRANPYPLAEFLAWHGQRTVGADLDAVNRRLWDPADPRALRIEDLKANADGRERRAKAGAALLELWQQLGSTERSATAEKSEWNREFAYRLGSAFAVRSSLSASPTWEQSLLREQYRRQFRDYVVWLSRRIALDAAALPPDLAPDSYANTMKLFDVVRRGQSIELADSELRVAHTFEVVGEGTLSLDEATAGEALTLRIRANREPGPDEKPVLWVHWDPSQLGLELPKGTADSQPGRASQAITLGDKLAGEIPMRLWWTKPPTQPADVHLRVELQSRSASTGNLYASWDWLGALRVVKREALPRLRISIAGREPIQAREVDVYLLPGTPERLTVATDRPLVDPKQYSIVWESGEERRRLPAAPPEKAEKPEEKPPAKPEADTRLTLTDNRARVMLMQGDKAVDTCGLVFRVIRPIDYLVIHATDIAYSELERRLVARVTRRPKLVASVNKDVALRLSIDGIPDSELKKERAFLSATLRAGATQPAELSAVVPKAFIKSDMVAVISMQGYERVFRYRFGPGQQPEPITDYQIRLADPPPGAKIMADPSRKELVLTLHADGPYDAGVDRDYQVSAGFAASEESVDNYDQILKGRKCRDGRMVEIRLGPTETGAVVEALVSDVKLRATNAEGFGGRMIVVAELHSPQGDIHKKETFDLYFLPEDPPRPDLSLTPPKEIVIGRQEPAVVEISGDPADMRLIDRLVVGLDVNGNGKLEQTEPHRQFVPQDGQRSARRWEIEVPTRHPALKPDRQVTVLAVASIQVVGAKSKTIEFPPYEAISDVVTAPAVTSDKPTKTGTLVIRVFRGTIRVEQVGALQFTPDPKVKVVPKDGDFVVENIPVGKYTIDIEDPTKNYAGSRTVEVVEGKNPLVQVPLSPK
jgi:hypothetical protein